MRPFLNWRALIFRLNAFYCQIVAKFCHFSLTIAAHYAILLLLRPPQSLALFRSELLSEQLTHFLCQNKSLCERVRVRNNKRHIIAQRIGWVTDEINGNYTLGIDYRFKRTPELDALYDARFYARTEREGRRLRMDEGVAKDMDGISGR